MIKHVSFLSDIWKPLICLYTFWICGCTECRINDAVFLKLTWSWNLLLRSIHEISVPQYTLWASLLMFIIPNNTLLMALDVLKPSITLPLLRVEVLLLHHLFKVYILFLLPPPEWSLIQRCIQDWRDWNMKAQPGSHCKCLAFHLFIYPSIHSETN